ncbi:hypothetical protein CcrJ4_gp409 [Caulobacter phage J4]|nr:hypothetical protein CcrJ4_gp409 [Caulobacter phage J4]UTU10275.1 hypothetical protein CcrRB23_gp413 [Caulobacter phage RB23]
MTRLTQAQRRIVSQALDHPLNLAEPHHSWNGLRRANWHTTMSRLVAEDVFRPYAHGGYELTEKGKAFGRPPIIPVDQAQVERTGKAIQKSLAEPFVIPRKSYLR